MAPAGNTNWPPGRRRLVCSSRRGGMHPERNSDTPRVLVVATSLWPPGGVERYSAELVGALADLAGDDRVDVLPLWRPRGARAPRGRVVFGGRPPGRMGAVARGAYAAAGLLAVLRRRPDVVVVAHPHLAHAGAILAAVARRPLVVVAHGSEVWDRCSPQVRWGLRRARQVWPVSAFTAAELVRRQGVDAARVRVLPPGLPVAPFLGPGRAPVVLTVARLSPECRYKGVDTLLRCWPAVRRAVPDARLLVVGDGPDRARLEALAPARGVRFTGAVSDAELAKRYATAAVLALPSRARTGSGAEGEGFGLVYVEGALAGLPVLAGEGGAVEAVVDGETGVVVDPRDEEAVTASLVGLLRDPGRAARLGRAGRRRAVEHFSTDAFRARIGDALRTLS